MKYAAVFKSKHDQFAYGPGRDSGHSPPSWPRQSWLRSKQMSTLMSEQHEGDSEEGLEEEEEQET